MYLHRDIKPGNIMIEFTGGYKYEANDLTLLQSLLNEKKGYEFKVRLIDLGFTKKIEKGKGDVSLIGSNLKYMAEEERKYNEQSDNLDI